MRRPHITGSAVGSAARDVLQLLSQCWRCHTPRTTDAEGRCCAFYDPMREEDCQHLLSLRRWTCTFCLAAASHRPRAAACVGWMGAAAACSFFFVCKRREISIAHARHETLGAR